jgi:hypothetical protein
MRGNRVQPTSISWENVDENGVFLVAQIGLKISKGRSMRPLTPDEAGR